MNTSRFEDRVRMHLYDRGHTDDAIAEHLGLTLRTVERWRRRKGLPAHLVARE